MLEGVPFLEYNQNNISRNLKFPTVTLHKPEQIPDETRCADIKELGSTSRKHA